MAKIIVREARLAFPDLYEAVQFQGQGPFQYRATLLVPPKSDSDTLINATIAQVAKEKWGAKAEAVLKTANATQKICYIDGNTKAYNGYAGNWALTATRALDAGKPATVNRNPKIEVQSSEGLFYSGAFVNATVEIWAQDNSFGKSVRATLVNVQFLKHGESFGGAAPASADGLDELDFEDEEDLI